MNLGKLVLLMLLAGSLLPTGAAASESGTPGVTPAVPLRPEASAERSGITAGRGGPLAIPVFFERNIGQRPKDTDFVVRGPGFEGSIRSGEVDFRLPGVGEPTRVTLRAVAPRDGVQVEPGESHPGRANYLVGRDDRSWIRGASLHKSVVLREVWRGTDLRWLDEGGHLRFDLVLDPRADPERIRFQWDGWGALRMDAAGRLHGESSAARLIQSPPRAWQDTSKGRIPVSVRYHLEGERFGFVVGRYDPELPLVIDPTVEFATKLGSGNTCLARVSGIDSLGNHVVVGETTISNFPTTPGVIQEIIRKTAEVDIFIAKFDRHDHSILFATYFGGNGDDRCYGLALNEDDELYLTGYCVDTGNGFPLVHAAQPKPGGNRDAFITRLTAAADDVVYSTFLGGSLSEEGGGIALGPDGSAWVVGTTYSSNFPTRSAFDDTLSGNSDAYVTRLSPDGETIEFSSYLGGQGAEPCDGVAVAPDGKAWVCGTTTSSDFPTVQGWQSVLSGNNDAFITVIDPADDSIAFSTLVGGAALDQARDIEISAFGEVAVAGDSISPDFPTKNGLQLSSGLNKTDAFVLKINSFDHSLIWATMLGGTEGESGTGVGIDNDGFISVTGHTASPAFPLADSVQNTVGGGNDYFVARISPDGATLAFSSFYGGPSNEAPNDIATDGGGVFVVGAAFTGFPEVNGRGESVAGSVLAGLLAIEYGPEPLRRFRGTILDDGSVLLTWIDPHEMAFDVEVHRRIDGGAWEVPTVVVDGVEFVLYDPPAENALLEFYLKGVSDTESTPISNWVTIRAAPNQPVGLSASAVSNRSVQLDWTDTSSVEVAYDIVRRIQGSGKDFEVVSTLPSDSDSHLDAGAEPETVYEYAVRARSAYGSTSQSDPVIVTTPPRDPSGLKVVSTNDVQLGFEWADNSNAEASFALERSVDGQDWVSAGAIPADAIQAISDGLSGETSYRHRIRAVNEHGHSEWSAEAEAATAPPRPESTAVRAISSTAIEMSWVDVATTETRFEVQYRRIGDSGWTSFEDIVPNEESIVLDGLDWFTGYEFRVRAFGASSISRFTGEVTTLTDALLIVERATLRAAKGKSPARLDLTGTCDFGSGTFDPAAPATLGVGPVELHATALAPSRNGKSFTWEGESGIWTMFPPKSAGGRWKIRATITGADVPPLVDSYDLVLRLESESLVASGAIRLTNGRFDLKKATGEWGEPSVFIAALKAVIKQPTSHKLSVVAYFDPFPAGESEPRAVMMSLGKAWNLTVDALEFDLKKERWTFRSTTNGSWNMTVDPRKGTFKLKASGLNLGEFPEGALATFLSLRIGDRESVGTPVLFSDGSRLGF